MKKEFVIRPAQTFTKINFKELWEYRSLFESMVRRHIKTEFHQQILAYIWPVFRPLLMVFLFTAFRNLSEARTGVNISYPIYAYSGLILWFMFIEAVTETSSSIKRNAGLIKKVYFPKILAPLAIITANFAIFSLNIVPLIGMMVLYNVYPGWNILLLPIVLLQLSMLILGIGCIFAALGLNNNDWDRFLGFALYVGLFISPVLYSPGMFSEKYHLFYSLNPMVGFLLAFRWTLFSDFPIPLNEWLFSSILGLIIAFIGLVLFKRAEKHFADGL